MIMILYRYIFQFILQKRNSKEEQLLVMTAKNTKKMKT